MVKVSMYSITCSTFFLCEKWMVPNKEIKAGQLLPGLLSFPLLYVVKMFLVRIYYFHFTMFFFSFFFFLPSGASLLWLQVIQRHTKNVHWTSFSLELQVQRIPLVWYKECPFWLRKGILYWQQRSKIKHSVPQRLMTGSSCSLSSSRPSCEDWDSCGSAALGKKILGEILQRKFYKKILHIHPDYYYHTSLPLSEINYWLKLYGGIMKVHRTENFANFFLFLWTPVVHSLYKTCVLC